MALDWLKILEWFKPRPSLYLAIFLASGVLLFAPEQIVRLLALDAIVSDHRAWIGALFLVSACLLLAQGSGWLFANTNSPLYRWWQTRRLHVFLEDLSSPEKAVLKKFVERDETTQYFEYQDGVVSGLVKKRILWRASDLAASFTTFAYNIQPWAREYLRKYPKLLQ